MQPSKHLIEISILITVKQQQLETSYDLESDVLQCCFCWYKNEKNIMYNFTCQGPHSMMRG